MWQRVFSQFRAFDAQEGRMPACFVCWSERVLHSWIVTELQGVVATATAHLCTTLRFVTRPVIVDAQRRLLIHLESLPLPVWTFRRDGHGPCSPHLTGEPFHWRFEVMRTMVLELACVDFIETPFPGSACDDHDLFVRFHQHRSSHLPF